MQQVLPEASMADALAIHCQPNLLLQLCRCWASLCCRQGGAKLYIAAEQAKLQVRHRCRWLTAMYTVTAAEQTLQMQGPSKPSTRSSDSMVLQDCSVIVCCLLVGLKRLPVVVVN